MQPDWEYVKKSSLWHYEELIKKLQVVPAYPVLWQAYNHDMPQAANFARRLFADKNITAGEFPATVIRTIKRLEKAAIGDWGHLFGKVTTRQDCAGFVANNKLDFKEFIDLLGYLLRWGFPFQTASRELLDHESPQEMAFYPALKQHGFRNSFDLLESGRTEDGRRSMVRQSGLPLEFVISLVHRADIARLPFVRRKTVLAVCGAGYDTLVKIARADPADMESALDSYFRQAQGKSWNNFKSVILPRSLITTAQALPLIIDQPPALLAVPERSKSG